MTISTLVLTVVRISVRNLALGVYKSSTEGLQVRFHFNYCFPDHFLESLWTQRHPLRNIRNIIIFKF
jgi:hypothetical protein